MGASCRFRRHDYIYICRKRSGAWCESIANWPNIAAVEGTAKNEENELENQRDFSVSANTEGNTGMNSGNKHADF